MMYVGGFLVVNVEYSKTLTVVCGFIIFGTDYPFFEILTLSPA